MTKYLFIFFLISTANCVFSDSNNIIAYLGNIYYEHCEYDKALNQFQKSLSLYREDNITNCVKTEKMRQWACHNFG